MQESNGSQAPSQGLDFNQAFRKAKVTGDFDFVLDTAKKSHKMLLDFRNVVCHAKFAGADAHSVAMGLNFLENMIANSAGQLSALKQTEKETRDAMKAENGAVPKKPPEDPTPDPAPSPEAD